MDVIKKPGSVVDLRRGLSRQARQKRRFEASLCARNTRSQKFGQRQHYNKATSTTSPRVIARKNIADKEGFKCIMKEHSSRYNIIGSVVVFAVVLGLFIFTSLTSVEILFWVFFVSMFYWHIDSRVSISGALVCLVVIPILLVFHNNLGFARGEVWAETVAVWAYFFLVIGVVKQIWEYVVENRKARKEMIKRVSLLNTPRKDV